MKRYLKTPLKQHLKTLRQMIFLVGPRQVGKTTLAKQLIPRIIDGVNYFNWDLAKHRTILTRQVFPGKLELSGAGQEIIVFDEIHKYHRWKNALKGLFDKYEPEAHWIVTGSAALNVYRKGQDSLMGRSFTYHLCPLSVAELDKPKRAEVRGIDELSTRKVTKPDAKTQNNFEHLLSFSGFPEPFLKKSPSFLRRWRTARLDRLINQDLAAIENLRHLPLVENLMFLLPERIGSPLSLNSLREDLEVHFATVKHWIKLLERIFYGFSVKPFTGKLARMIKKEVKWYLWDWTEIENEGYRFENLVAVHLLKYVHYINDLGLDDISLHYVRDTNQREVDFLVCRNKKPIILIECKASDASPSKSLAHFSRLLKVQRAIQVTAEPIHPRAVRQQDIQIDIVPASSFLKELV